MLRFAALGTAKRNTASKRKTMLRFASPRLRFESYAAKIIITICVNLLRFALCFYVLGNVTFCGPTLLHGRLVVIPDGTAEEDED